MDNSQKISKKLRLGVNIDHVATVRNARGSIYPQPILAAEICEKAGADGITAHLREDRRHIIDADIDLICKRIKIPLNLEMAPTAEMQNIALRSLPNAVCLVPEKREEKTTEGGLEVASQIKFLTEYIRPLRDKGCKVSLFVNAEKTQIESAAAVGATTIELHTGAYCDLYYDSDPQGSSEELSRLRQMAFYAESIGLEVHAGHGLTLDTVEEIAAIPEIEELNIGHAIISEAIFVGLCKSINDIRKIMELGRYKNLQNEVLK